MSKDLGRITPYQCCINVTFIIFLYVNDARTFAFFCVFFSSSFYKSFFAHHSRSDHEICPRERKAESLEEVSLLKGIVPGVLLINLEPKPGDEELHLLWKKSFSCPLSPIFDLRLVEAGFGKCLYFS